LKKTAENCLHLILLKQHDKDFLICFWFFFLHFQSSAFLWWCSQHQARCSPLESRQKICPFFFESISRLFGHDWPRRCWGSVHSSCLGNHGFMSNYKSCIQFRSS